MVTTWILLILIGILASFGFVWYTFAPWVPTRKRDFDRILRLADLGAGKVFYDLGSGTGDLVCYLARRSEGEVVGVELAWPLYIISVVRKILRRSSGRFLLQNLYRVDLEHVDVVYAFGIPDTLQRRLKHKLASELKPGACVLSYAFAIHGWEPVHVDRPTEHDLPIFVYRITQKAPA